jgi:hypothetical protein
MGLERNIWFVSKYGQKVWMLGVRRMRQLKPVVAALLCEVGAGVEPDQYWKKSAGL